MTQPPCRNMQLQLLLQFIGEGISRIVTPRQNGATLPLRILSHNIRYATKPPFTNERPWPERLPLILNTLTYHTRHLDGGFTDLAMSGTGNFRGSAFICLQEVLHVQLHDILLGLNGIELSVSQPRSSTLPEGPIWAHIGVAREDGKKKGEYSPIFYPVRSFRLLHFENTWLSPTPDRPSTGWDAGSMRILTLGVFEHRASGKRVIACCTHLDNVGSKSRQKSVEIILDKIQSIREKWSKPSSWTSGQNNTSIPVFLAGDFNSFPDQEAYLAMEDSKLMCDLRNSVKPSKQYGEHITFTGFEPERDKDEQGRIDFIWLGPRNEVLEDQSLSPLNEKADVCTKNSMWQVDGYAVLPNLFEDNVYSSDHRCVVGDVSLYVNR